MVFSIVRRRLAKTPYGSFVARALLRDDRVNYEGAMRLFKSLDQKKMVAFSGTVGIPSIETLIGVVDFKVSNMGLKAMNTAEHRVYPGGYHREKTNEIIWLPPVPPLAQPRQHQKELEESKHGLRFLLELKLVV